MISSADQYGNQISLRDRSGQQVGNLTIAQNAEFLGHSSTFVVIRNGGMIITLDENQHTLGSVVLPLDYRIGGITDSGFYAKTGGLTIVFDPNCNIINKY